MNRKFSWPAIYIVVAITLLSLIPLSHLKFEFNIEKLFPVRDPDLAFFQEFQHQFHSEIDDEFIFIGLKNEEGIFRQDFLKKNRQSYPVYFTTGKYHQGLFTHQFQPHLF